ncbi:MAG TPA: two-component regulator propeller domain-containing protein [Pyrinomonadaceae bacterium]|nr:two-component regulator propeller domain-containing protein [Pyrinomonadaceae bacterium]
MRLCAFAGNSLSYFGIGILSVCLLLVCCNSAYALNPSVDVDQYSHTNWKIRDGFPKGAIMSMAQTPDGYLWLGTEFGLFRFDGLRSNPWQPPTQQLPATMVMSLLAARDGSLWIGTAKGLAKWKDGTLTQYEQLAGKYVFKIVEDREGTIWASGIAVTTGRLCAIKNSGVHCAGDDGSLGRGAFNLFADSKGNLWAGMKDGLWRFSPGPPQFYPLAGEPDGIQGIGEDVDGTLVIGWKGAIHKFIDGKTEPYALSGIDGPFNARRILRDRDGALWIGTGDRGIVHVHHGRAGVFGPSDGLSGTNIYSLFEDREGNIWAATADGLDRFRDFAVVTFSSKQGLSSGLVGSVLAVKDGSIWLSTRGGLSRWHNGQITIVSTGQLNGQNPHTLFQDNTGRIWVSTQSGFGYLQNDRFRPVSSVPGAINSITQDTAGDLWFANEHAALFQVRGDSVVQQIPWANLGRNDPAGALAADPSRGGVWIGFTQGGVARFADNKVEQSYGAGEGFAEGRVNDLRFDSTGALWASADGGLSRLKDGRVTTLKSRNGLPCDTMHWIIEDTAGSFWLDTACGLLRITRQQLDAWISAVDQDKAAKPVVQFVLLDSSDGVRSVSSGTHFSPQVTQAADGKLWFYGGDGVSVVDPLNLPFNKLAPPVHVERFIADRETYDATASGPLRLPPLIRDLQIDYTALSLVAPERILFRYKLEGRDPDWQEVTDRRQVFYNDLPPGNYRFRVMAANNSGLWNEAGTYFDFTIAPAYYQTTWFRIAVLAAVLLALGAIYQIRLRQVARQVRGRMEERLEERERIARDLHDTLLQGVQGLILKFHAISKQIPKESPAYNALEKTLDHADEVLAEGRDRIRNLRVDSASLSDLPAAFRTVAEETSQGREAVFKTVVEGHVRDLHPLVLEECYCIGREAIINALSHSHGQHVEAEIAYDSRQFRLRVRDDGRGIDPKFLEAGGRSGHWGLQGMRERTQKIGGQLKFWSRPETGTEVELTVPGATAYLKNNGD